MSLDEGANVGQMEEMARKRKERLQALKRKAQPGDDGHGAKHVDTSLPKPVFRSYNPSDESLKEHKLELSVPITVDEQVKDELEAKHDEELVDEIDLTNLAPRKVDWDLKRNIAKKLNRLEKRTQRAIAEVIREKIIKETEQQTATT